MADLTSEMLIIGKMVEDDLESLSEITNNDNIYKYISPFLYKKSRGNLLAAIEELRSGVQQHYQTVRKYAIETGESLYSCGWLLDIARCIYTLRYNDIISKTKAGE